MFWLKAFGRYNISMKRFVLVFLFLITDIISTQITRNSCINFPHLIDSYSLGNLENKQIGILGHQTLSEMPCDLDKAEKEKGKWRN